ncbi:alpha-amylase family protein [Nocardia sp. CA-084685]|uniref:alpha-amylase family protein n=1 Tax=Nocardia sp. CA-084685 TaxID=3239970 RepID=UPI003D963626
MTSAHPPERRSGTAWHDHVLWWHLHPLTFTGAEPAALPEAAAPIPRLDQLHSWLDYLIELGCNGLALGPVFASATHGYDTIDHFRIDSRLGSEAEFLALVQACRQRGIRVLLDGVFNHVGREFPAFQDVVVHRAASRYASWFRVDFDEHAPDGFNYVDFEGHRNLVALNHCEPAIADYVCEVMRYWLERGIDGWRLDAAYAVPAPFWRTVINRVAAQFPYAMLVGEVIHGDYRAFVHDGGLDTVTQYELWKAIWGSLNDRNFFELAWSINRHNDFARAFLPLTFVGNHDVTRIASRLNHPQHLGHALVVLFTLAGHPSIYAGDEQAFRGVKYDRLGGDDEIRPEFPTAPAALPAHGWPTYRLHQKLISLRRTHPWLNRCRVEICHLTNRQIAYTATDPDSDSQLTVLLNIDESRSEFPLSTLPSSCLLASDDSPPTRTVEAHGWAILQ